MIRDFEAVVDGNVMCDWTGSETVDGKSVGSMRTTKWLPNDKRNVEPAP